VGNYVHIAPGANVSGNVHLHDGCWVGAGSIVNQGNPVKRLEVGANTIVGSGAVVISDCDPDAVYAGVPATRVK
jgi:acetyltransferase-like isoleucine patch superfamily enzyme